MNTCREREIETAFIIWAQQHGFRYHGRQVQPAGYAEYQERRLGTNHHPTQLSQSLAYWRRGRTLPPPAWAKG